MDDPSDNVAGSAGHPDGHGSQTGQQADPFLSSLASLSASVSEPTLISTAASTAPANPEAGELVAIASTRRRKVTPSMDGTPHRSHHISRKE